jgi:hypothetical protein
VTVVAGLKSMLHHPVSIKTGPYDKFQTSTVQGKMPYLPNAAVTSDQMIRLTSRLAGRAKRINVRRALPS